MLSALIIDDDADLLEMVGTILTNHGIKATCVGHADEITEILKKKKPDIILMDIYFGNADGREVCRTLKSSKRFHSIPIILYSAGQITSASVNDSKADDFISKPFNIRELMRKIGSLIKAKPSAN